MHFGHFPRKAIILLDPHHKIHFAREEKTRKKPIIGYHVIEEWRSEGRNKSSFHSLLFGNSAEISNSEHKLDPRRCFENKAPPRRSSVREWIVF